MPRKKKETQEPLVEATEDFIVVTGNSTPPVSGEAEYSVEKEIDRLLEQAMKSFDMTKRQSSVYMDDAGSYHAPTQEELATLATAPQDDLKKILRINSVIAKYANLDDLIGTVTESIRINLNDDYRLSYKNVEGRNKLKNLERVKAAIDSFNEDVGIKRLIRETIPRTYMEGTSIMYLRKHESGWVVDTYPLGVAIISPYSVAGDPVVLIDMNVLKQRLNKMGYRTRGGKNMFFDSVEQEISENFPKEVYDAYKNKEPYAKLDINYTGVVRVGNYGRKYGVSPILKSLSSALLLESFTKSDMANAKARAKKIVYQILNKELLGDNGGRNPLQQQAFAHQQLVAAVSQAGSALYTAPAFVKEVGIIEPKGEMIDKDVVMYYTNKEMAALGISFLSVEKNSSISSAKISLEQLMRNINSISRSLDEVFEKFYIQVLKDEGLDPAMSPRVQIIDSEALEMEMRIKLVDVIYSKLNMSLRTAMETLGYDFDDELSKRMMENRDGVEKEFFARESQFTKSADSNNETGRPKGEENGKQNYDENYNELR